MELGTQPIVAAVLILTGTALGYALRKIIAQQKKNSIEIEIQKRELQVKTETQGAILEAKQKASEILEEAKAEEKRRVGEIRKSEERISHKEEVLEKKLVDFEQEKVERVRAVQEALREKEAEKQRELERVAHLSEEEAKQALFSAIEKKHEADFLERLHKLELTGEERLSHKARDILAAVIQRVATSTASEVTTTSVQIPSEDLKGKIIGREGRNIRALERAAGVEIIVDDT